MSDLITTLSGKDHSACGVGLIVNLKESAAATRATRSIVETALKVLGDFDYRAGYNPVTGEGDGAGLRLFGLPTKFFERKFTLTGTETHPSLVDGKYAIGQYFLPSDNTENLNIAKKLIEEEAAKQGLRVAAWRDLNEAIDLSVISENARKKKPALWQALLLPISEDIHLEQAASHAAIEITNEAVKSKIALNIVSQSSQSIVYKGMIRSDKLGLFYTDLQDPDFSAVATQVHARYATNTNPQWSRAQPCTNFLAHNGEFNSAPANASDMINERKAHPEAKGAYPHKGLSDSMQFDVDLANQMSLHACSLEEALLRLMPPSSSASYPAEINAMLDYLRLIRPPYNGPAFAVVGAYNSYIAKLDSAGLRPSRYSIIRDSEGKAVQLHAASDDYLAAAADAKTTKSQLEPGGMIMVTPEGEILKTLAILERIKLQISTRRNSAAGAGAIAVAENHFQNLLKERVFSLDDLSDTEVSAKDFIATPTEKARSSELNRKLYAAFFDLESAETVGYMASNGAERVGAMGDDTDPLHISKTPVHIAYFLHQLFAQVSAPSLDSIKEIDRFNISSKLGSINNGVVIKLDSPILGVNDLEIIENQNRLPVHKLDTSFAIDPSKELTSEEAGLLLSNAIQALLSEAEKIAEKGGIILVSDRAASSSRALIPDVLAIAAIRQHLENKNLIQNVSLIADSYQLSGPHHASVLLAMGAHAVYARGAYEKIKEQVEDGVTEACANYKYAQEKCLLKTMGKMGITDFDNYRGGQLVAGLGLDLKSTDESLADKPSLAAIFPRIYSPLRGLKLADIAKAALERHQQAYNADKDFSLLPRSGDYMPNKNGIEHGYGPEVVNAFGDWMKSEEVRSTRLRLHKLLEARGLPQWLSPAQLADYQSEKGFLDPSAKDAEGFYDPTKLESFKASARFKEMIKLVDERHRAHPTSIHNRFTIKAAAAAGAGAGSALPAVSRDPKSLEKIRKRLFGGGMSRGALSVSNPDKPENLGAHETLARGLNAIGAVSAAGEGGETPEDLSRKLSSCQVKQIASGRFGVSAEQILAAEEMEIKVAQGAKPGEGGQVPADKISISIAALRGSLPGIALISPPPHHDIYSIEDLAQLISDIKSVNPRVKVSVKLVASEGIGTIAVGVAKAGADIINIAGNSGGTGAAQQSSIKSAGLPAELGLAEVHRALSQAGLRNLVQLRTSGGYLTADDIIIASILGADLFELGRSLLLTIGCIMQRTCNESCAPGVAKDGHLFKGNQVNTERYVANLAAAVHERLAEMGFSSLDETRGRTELLDLINKEEAKIFDNFSAILNRSDLPAQPSAEELALVQSERQATFLKEKDKEIKLSRAIEAQLAADKDATIDLPATTLDTQDRSFGAYITGQFSRRLKANPKAQLNIKTQGVAGQSYGAFLSTGMRMDHTGLVQDGCAKSMSGGELILRTPNLGDSYKADENTIAGNVMCYGASGGKIFVNGQAGHRFGILLKGAQVVVEGAGDLAFEYMTSGSALILGAVGKGLATGASGGIIFAYDPAHNLQTSNSVRMAEGGECGPYEAAIKAMLSEHQAKTGSSKAHTILSHFNLNDFKILIPNDLDNIKSISAVTEIIKTYLLRKAPLTAGMQVWLEQKALGLVRLASLANLKRLPNDELHQLYKVLLSPDLKYLGLSSSAETSLKELSQLLPEAVSTVAAGPSSSMADLEDFGTPGAGAGAGRSQSFSVRRTARLVAESVGSASSSSLSGADPSAGSLASTPSALSFGSVTTQASVPGTPNSIPKVAHKDSSPPKSSTKKIRSPKERLSSIAGITDAEFLEILSNITKHVSDLSQDGTGCSSCGSQSCSGGAAVNTGCPAGKPIHDINKNLKKIGAIGATLSAFQWKNLRQAFEEQIKESPFIAYTGAACPAPCESGCTESIPTKSGALNPKRANKLVGEAVHIKNIEFALYRLGRFMGWFDGKPSWKEEEADSIFGTPSNRSAYDELLADFTPAFTPAARLRTDKKLSIVGSGPAAMQIAFQALRDGVAVTLYEKSDKAGGLLRNGIPHHKFDKEESLTKDFAYLKAMGLELHLNTEVEFSADQFRAKDASGESRVIAAANDANHKVVLAIGSGKAKELDTAITKDLAGASKEKVIQAIPFLKIVNDIAEHLQKNPELNTVERQAEREAYIASKLGPMDPRGKKVLVIGGGDTAQDVIRWICHYIGIDNFDDSKAKRSISLEPEATDKLHIAVRGPAAESERGTMDSYPHLSLTPTLENELRAEEVKIVGGKIHQLVKPTKIADNESGSLSVTLEESNFKYGKEMSEDENLRLLFASLPREARPLKPETTTKTHEFDLVFCALGFESSETIPLVQTTKGFSNVFVVGDAADAGQAKIIVSAQENARKTYLGKIRAALGINSIDSALSTMANLLKIGLFSTKVKAVLPLEKGTLSVTPGLAA